MQPFALQCQLGFDQRDIVGNIMANVDVRKCDKLASRSLIARVTRLISNAAARRHVVEGQPGTAMRGRIPWQGAAVERDARPGDALHVWHVGIVIQVRVMVLYFLDDAEDPGGRLASLGFYRL